MNGSTESESEIEILCVMECGKCVIPTIMQRFNVLVRTRRHGGHLVFSPQFRVFIAQKEGSKQWFLCLKKPQILVLDGG